MNETGTVVNLYTLSYHYIHNYINIGLFVLLVIGLILGLCLIYRKHKGEKGLWKKVLKRDLICFLIVAALWFIVSLIFRFIM